MKIIKLSVIIPIYNEMRNLAKTLDKLKVFSEDTEIIFVDGGSTDGSQDFIREHGHIILDSKKGRGAQLKKGAEEAQGDLLLFLHGDSYFDKNPLKEIKKILRTYKWGAFTLKFTGNHPWLTIIAFNSSNRVRFRNIAFGDQGIFMEKKFYESMGGFKELPLMEDYDLSIRIKEKGYRIGLSEQKIYTSSERFEKNGYVKTMVNMQYCQHLFRKGLPVDKIMKEYK